MSWGLFKGGSGVLVRKGPFGDRCEVCGKRSTVQWSLQMESAYDAREANRAMACGWRHSSCKDHWGISSALARALVSAVMALFLTRWSGLESNWAE